MSTKDTRLVTFLKEAMARRGINMSQLAAYTGVSHVTVLRWLRGTYVPKPESCHRLASYLHVSEDRLLELAGHRRRQTPPPPPESFTERLRLLEMEAPTEVPVYEQIGHTGPGGGVPTEYTYVSPRLAKGRKLAAIHVKGDCMEPLIREGDLIIVDLDGSPEVGDVVAVVVDSEDVQIKRLAGKTDGTVRLSCDNAIYATVDVEDVRIIGVVMETTRRLKA